MYYKVILQAKQKGIADGLTYESNQELSIGDLVEVPLRTMNSVGVIVEQVSKPEYSTKQISRVIQKKLLLPIHVKLAMWIADYYLTSLRSTLGLFLPGTSWMQYIPDQLLELNTNYDGKSSTSIKKLTAALELASPQLASDLCENAKVTTATLQKQLSSGVLNIAKNTTSRTKTHTYKLPELSAQQQLVHDSISADKPNYIFGVTGSGKTEVYCHQIKAVLEQGKQALVLLPEIFVTEHSKLRYFEYFPTANVVIWHSKMTPKQRLRTWKQIASGNADIIIGSRSALYTPWQKLGLIVVDEEHEWTYKQDTAPRYHVRETALHLQKTHDIQVIFGSATPSLEAWHAMEIGAFTKHELPERYASTPMPEVKIVDLTTTYSGATYPFSEDLLIEMRNTLAKNDKVVLFLNKRGVASCVLCTSCKRRLMSAKTQLPLSVHKTRDGREFLYDQFTQAQFPVPNDCPHCGKELLTVGIGTQGIEELCGKLFPTTPLWRIDGDTLKNSSSMDELLHEIASSKGGIIVGTQSVVKGLDLPDVTLSAVLIADIGLSLPHFRATERVFQLLMQLAGRSGRHRPGKVLIQTFRPETEEVAAVKEHDATMFYSTEYAMRKLLQYPPYQPLVRVLFRGATAKADCHTLSKRIEELVENNEYDCTVLSSPTFFSGGNVWQCLLRGKDAKQLVKQCKTNGFIDVDPLETL